MRITEIFHSIQGEGYLMGERMLFIRTNRCNLRCNWCDSKYTFSGGEEYTVEQIMQTVRDSTENWVCFTGGEPLIQSDAPFLVKSIVEYGKNVLIETSGSISIAPYTFSDKIIIDMDIKTPSSGEEKSLRMENLDLIRETDYLKFVISDDADYEYSVDFLSRINKDVKVVFQPAWGTDIRKLVENVLKDGLNVRVLPQFHKIIWGEIRGV